MDDDSGEDDKDWFVEPEALPLLSDLLNGTMSCPVCLDDLQPPVNQCSNGHLLCNECITKVASCPICREPLPAKTIRNLFLENLMKALLTKCSIKDCNKFFRTKGSMEAHAGSCGASSGEPAEGSNARFGVFYEQETAQAEYFIPGPPEPQNIQLIENRYRTQYDHQQSVINQAWAANAAALTNSYWMHQNWTRSYYYNQQNHTFQPRITTAPNQIRGEQPQFGTTTFSNSRHFMSFPAPQSIPRNTFFHTNQ